MSELPLGWRRVSLSEVAGIQGGIQKQPKRSPRCNRHPFLRVANVTASGLDLRDVHEMELFGDELERLCLAQGDLLVVEGNGSPSQIGRAAVWDGSIEDCVHQNHLIRVRPSEQVLPKYLGLVWNSPTVRAELTAVSSSTSGLHTLSVAKLKRVEFPLPPLDEQARIVDILEDQLSRLDAASGYLDAAKQRLEVMVSSVLVDLIPDTAAHPDGWKCVTVAEAGTVELGRQRHPDWHHGSNMKPYLRVANVFEDHIDTSSVMDMHWPDATFERFRLHPGDLLLNEGQTPDLLGRPAIYRGEPSEVAFTNSLLRFKASADVLPEFALLVFRRHMRAGRFKRESRITTNIAHLSVTRLKSVEFPLPPVEVQRRIVSIADAHLSAVSRMAHGIDVAETQHTNLRQSLLAAAFSGRLTGAPSDLDLRQAGITAVLEREGVTA